jgi:hypothetical protein
MGSSVKGTGDTGTKFAGLPPRRYCPRQQLVTLGGAATGSVTGGNA